MPEILVKHLPQATILLHQHMSKQTKYNFLFVDGYMIMTIIITIVGKCMEYLFILLHKLSNNVSKWQDIIIVANEFVNLQNYHIYYKMKISHRIYFGDLANYKNPPN